MSYNRNKKQEIKQDNISLSEKFTVLLIVQIQLFFILENLEDEYEVQEYKYTDFLYELKTYNMIKDKEKNIDYESEYTSLLFDILSLVDYLKLHDYLLNEDDTSKLYFIENNLPLIDEVKFNIVSTAFDIAKLCHDRHDEIILNFNYKEDKC